MKQVDARREILREWHALPKERRRTQDDATTLRVHRGEQVQIRRYLSDHQGMAVAGHVVEARLAGLGRALINSRCLLSGVKRKCAKGTGISPLTQL
jgi:hypothetical protein